MSIKTILNTVASKLGWPLTALAVLGVFFLAWVGVKKSAYSAAIEQLYQQAQEDHRAEFARRQLKIKQLEAAQAATAAAYIAKMKADAAAADAQVQALKWKSNKDLLAANATKEEILAEKGKVETALGVMTLNRNTLIAAAEARELEVKAEREKLKTEFSAALAAKQAELDICEKARKAALGEAGRKTWFTVGPAAMATIRGGVVQVAYGVSLQVPLVQIKSPFKG